MKYLYLKADHDQCMSGLIHLPIYCRKLTVQGDFSLNGRLFLVQARWLKAGKIGGFNCFPGFLLPSAGWLLLPVSEPGDEDGAGCLFYALNHKFDNQK